MISERAKAFIDGDAVIRNNGDRMVDASTAYNAVEIAEAEAAAERLERYRKDYRFLTEMRDRLDNADHQYVRVMMSDWLGELECELTNLNT